MTVAGTTRLKPGNPATSTPLRLPYGVAQDAAGVVYIADQFDNRILRVAVDGSIQMVAGTGQAGFSGDNGPALAAGFNEPRAIRLDPKGAALYVVDYNNNRVRKIDLAKGTVTTVAGNGDFHSTGDHGPATQAGMAPDDVAVGADGSVYVAEFLNNVIRKVSPIDGTITTITGNGIAGYGGDGGPAGSGLVNGPTGISVDSQNVIYFADYFNNVVRRINQTSGIIDTFAGTGELDIADGSPAKTAPLPLPVATAVESNGNILVLMALNFLQRVTASDGLIHTIAGGSNIGFGGDGGPAAFAALAFPQYVAAAANGDILLADSGNYRVRRIRSNIINTIAGTAINDNIPATSAFLNQPSSVVGTANGNFLIADTNDNRIRMVTNGSITNFAGTGVSGSTSGRLSAPTGVSRDQQGNVYVADWGNDRIVRYVPGGAPAVVAGGSGTGFSGDHGPATQAKLNGPTAVVVDAANNLYIADSLNCRVRMVDSNAIITTLAGNGQCYFSGDNGPAAQAGVVPLAVALDNGGNLLIADSTNRIRSVNLTTKIITTIAGVGTQGYTGDGGLATLAQLSNPTGISVDAAGSIYIADNGNEVVRTMRGGKIFTIAGTTDVAFDFDSGPALAVSMDPIDVFADIDGAIYITDFFNDRIRKLTAAIPATLTISSGDGQTGFPGNKLRIAAKVIDSGGNPIAGLPVSFSTATGAARLSSSSVLTDVTGIAATQVVLGNSPGPVTITASTSGLPSVTFTLTIKQPAVAGPQVTSIVGAGLSVPPVQALSPGGIVSVFGNTFGAGPAYQQVGSADLVNGQVPTAFKGICVDLSGVRAPILGASDTQVNILVPALQGASVAVTVISGCGTANQVSSGPVNAPVQSVAPEFFYFATNADGHNPVAAADALTGSYIGSPSLYPGQGFAPAHSSQYVTIYATGFGATNPNVTPGQFPQQQASVPGPVRVLLNGAQLPDSNVLYAGVTPGSPGLYQLNILLPDNTPNGDLQIIIEIGGVQSPPGAYITVLN
ncbi:MAG: hypothetical protein JO307_29325 [Bryobacterales bacterium]|nr:hypothetical protein [Bryobacterales bacterium]